MIDEDAVRAAEACPPLHTFIIPSAPQAIHNLADTLRYDDLLCAAEDTNNKHDVAERAISLLGEASEIRPAIATLQQRISTLKDFVTTFDRLIEEVKDQIQLFEETVGDAESFLEDIDRGLPTNSDIEELEKTLG